jgi:hypothetical protein
MNWPWPACSALGAFDVPHVLDDLKLDLNQLTGTIPPEIATNKNLSKLSSMVSYACIAV